MATTIRYIGGAPEVTFEIPGRHGATPAAVRHGETVEVPDDFAGTAPAGDDPGSGLLAQPTNFVAVAAKPATAKAQEAPNA
jgi:hypothetical protein